VAIGVVHMTSTQRTLSDVVSPALLRGVRIEKILGRFGARWVSSEGATDEQKNMDYSMSEPVERLNDFLSHDWTTGRWRKYLSLLVVYNLSGAVATGLLCFLVLLVLSDSSVGLIPIPPMMCPKNYTIAGEKSINIDEVNPLFLVGLVLCWFVFIFGQHIRSYICPCRPRFAFVDKMSIHQTDEHLKTGGILSLAGFLRATDRLVILWSPRYFTRLWCAYEVAAWLRLKAAMSSVKFMPVSYGAGLVAFHLWGIAFTSTFVIFCFTDLLAYFFFLLVSSTGVVLLHRMLLLFMPTCPPRHQCQGTL